MKDKLQYTIVFATMAVFILLYVLVSGDTRLEVIQIDDKGNELGTQTFKQLSAQSLFGQLDMLLQAAEPVQDGVYSVFKARVDNPYGKEAKLIQATIYRNNQTVQTKKFDQTLKAGGNYLFISDAIDMSGVQAARNKILISFVLEVDERRQTQYFEYDYLYLVKCTKDAECQVNMKCDRGNMARFSTAADIFYCVRTCASNTQCLEGQICIKGFCGY